MILNESNFVEQVSVGDVTLVDFYANWCGPCRDLEPTLNDLESDGFRIGKVNVEENANLSQKYNIASIPHMIIFKNGEPVERISGLQPKEYLVAKLNEHKGN